MQTTGVLCLDNLFLGAGVVVPVFEVWSIVHLGLRCKGRFCGLTLVGNFK